MRVLIDIYQGSFPMEDFDLKFTSTLELLILLVPAKRSFWNFVSEILCTKKCDMFILYMVVS